MTPLHYAAWNVQFNNVEYLINKKVDINAKTEDVIFFILILHLFIMLY